ncbi:hypothetical protein KNE206_05140 [Kitasatospora sp. NE20-6]|uniref:HNH endonuclease n=1 Tax=Kitasatospora sp. NE20-6 TaxID=2859066 RepID=UPI0034DC2A5B
MRMAAWLVLAVGDDRSHGGNDGYDDEPSRHYSWDSTVPNHAAMQPGDVIALWDKKALLGVSVIEDIATEQSEKDVYSCPACGRASFKARKTKLPVYVCWDCAAEFDVPNTRRRSVTTYRSRHDAFWTDMTGLLTGPVLRSLCDSPKSQNSLRPIRWDRLSAAIEATGGSTVRIVDAGRKGFHGDQQGFHGDRSMKGGHRIVTVRARLGQRAFRQRLLAEHGDTCAFTGPTPRAALDAAHLYSYAANGEHHEDGGLLLRRDLHRLFDLGLVAVHPERLTVDVSVQLAAYPSYAQLQDAAVVSRLSKGHVAWLEAHWTLHRTGAR